MIDLSADVAALFEEAQHLAPRRPAHVNIHAVYDGRRTPAARLPRSRQSPWRLVDRPPVPAAPTRELQPATCACGAVWEARRGASKLAHVGRTYPGCRPPATI